MGKGKPFVFAVLVLIIVFGLSSVCWGVTKAPPKNGYGTETDSDGNIYEGNFKNGEWDGVGRITYPDGRIMMGYFKDGYPVGLNFLYYPNGTIETMSWSNKKPIDVTFKRYVLEGSPVSSNVEDNVYTGSEKDLYYAGVLITAAIRACDPYIKNASKNPTADDKRKFINGLYWLERAQQMLISKQFPDQLSSIQLDMVQWLDEMQTSNWLFWEAFNTNSTGSTSEVLNKMDLAKKYAIYEQTLYDHHPSANWYDDNKSRCHDLYGTPPMETVITSKSYVDWKNRNSFRLGTMP